jgi:hypothetical protein
MGSGMASLDNATSNPIQSHYFDANDLSPLSVDQIIASWDKTHWHCIVSDRRSLGKKSILRFQHDADGKLDNVNGTLSTDEVTEMKCKYTNKVRPCLGCGVAMLANEKGQMIFGEDGTPICEGQPSTILERQSLQ